MPTPLATIKFLIVAPTHNLKNQIFDDAKKKVSQIYLQHQISSLIVYLMIL